MLLLIYFPLFVGVLRLFLFCCTLLCVHFSFCNHLEEDKIAGCFSIIVLQMFYYCKCVVSIPRGAMGWSAFFI